MLQSQRVIILFEQQIYNLQKNNDTIVQEWLQETIPA
jgi:hypothetical protein